MTGPGRRADRGFTLIELVVVLAILAIGVALVLPAVGRGVDAVRLRSEGGRVAALLRDARQRAIARRETVRVSLDRGRNTVTLSAGDTAATLRQIELPAGLRIEAARGPESLPFSSRGITRSARWILEGHGGRELAIDIDGVTGRVSVGRRVGA